MTSSSIARGGLRPLLWPTVLAALGVAVLLGLGTWQVERRAWKRDLIAQRDAALHGAAVPLPAVIADPAALELHRVWVEGRFQHARELHLTSRFHGEKAGFHIITPLVLADGAAVLVNRGWVPQAKVDPASRPAGQPEGLVRIEGVVRLPTAPGWFTPANEPAQNLWFYADIKEMAAAAGLGRVYPVLLEAGPAPNPGGLPIGGQTLAELPNDHLQYAITWYSLAAALAVIYGLFCQRHLRGDRPS